MKMHLSHWCCLHGRPLMLANSISPLEKESPPVIWHLPPPQKARSDLSHSRLGDGLPEVRPTLLALNPHLTWLRRRVHGRQMRRVHLVAGVAHLNVQLLHQLRLAHGDVEREEPRILLFILAQGAVEDGQRVPAPRDEEDRTLGDQG